MGVKGLYPETVKPDSKELHHTYNQIIGSNRVALEASASKAASLGYHTIVDYTLLTGDAEREGKIKSDWVLSHKTERPCCYLQGGETTVKVTGAGKGGRNQHFVLASLQELLLKKIKQPFALLSGGTDGTDGPTDAAGAIADLDLLETVLQKRISTEQYLIDHDAYHFFEQAGGLLITGPTQTNVMDLVVVLVS